MTDLPPLPPLPDPGVEFVLINGHQIPVRNAVCPFSGGQMRVYARAYGEACAAAYKADAERYRWLRSESPLVARFWQTTAADTRVTCAVMDAVIDMARGE